MSNFKEKDIERRIKISPNTQAKLQNLNHQIAMLQRELNDRIEIIADNAQIPVKPDQPFMVEADFSAIMVFKIVKNVTDKEAAIIEQALAEFAPAASEGN